MKDICFSKAHTLWEDVWLSKNLITEYFCRAEQAIIFSPEI